MPASIRFRPVELPGAAEELRAEVRAFLSAEIAAGAFSPRCDAWLGEYSPGFSRKLGERGWLGVTWPKRYGGHERSAFERFVVTEELLAAGARVASHWIADRRSGPSILRYGTEEQKERFLPVIARGECFFSIGMSEPESGSDLASVQTSAERVGDGWRINGTKIWTGGAHRSHHAIVLCRTSPPEERDRHAGLSQLIVDLSAPGITVSPIRLLTGEHVFNEVVMEDVEVPAEMVLGHMGEGWRQVTSELAFERSGPERFLSTFPLFVELVRALGRAPGERAKVEVGVLVARLWTLRRPRSAGRDGPPGGLGALGLRPARAGRSAHGGARAPRLEGCVPSRGRRLGPLRSRGPRPGRPLRHPPRGRGARRRRRRDGRGGRSWPLQDLPR